MTTTNDRPMRIGGGMHRPDEPPTATRVQQQEYIHMPFVSGFLRVRRRGGHPDQGLPGEEGPVDPGYGIEEGHPDQGLPGGIDDLVDPGWGVGIGERPSHPIALPKPPPGVWPPLTPSHPIQPAPPGTPPGSIWPPIGGPVDPGYGRPEGGRPDQGLPPAGGRPDQGLPPAGGRPDQGLPRPPASGGRPDQGLPQPQVWYVVAGIPGVGWRYIAVDPNARPAQPIAPTPEPK